MKSRWLLVLAASGVLAGVSMGFRCSPPEEDAPARVATKAAQVSAPFDPAQFIRQTIAFRAQRGAFEAGTRSYFARVTEDGRLEVTPVVGADAPRAGAGTFETTAIGRQSASPAGLGAVRLDGRGVAIERGAAVERIDNAAQGVEQSWRFAARPAGSGDLKVRVRASGLVFSGQDEHGVRFADASGRAALRYGHGTWIDAKGARTPVPVSFHAGELSLSVPAHVVDGSAYPAVLDPVISSEIGVNTPSLTAALQDQWDPAVAFDGTNYFVVWEDFRNYPQIDLLGARVSPTGKLLDVPNVNLTNTVDYYECYPTVAFDGTNYLVVWRHQLSPGGAPSLFARRVSKDMKLLEKDPITLASDGYYNNNPHVIFDGANFVVAWAHDQIGQWSQAWGIGLVRVSPAGLVLDQPVKTITGLDTSASPHIAFNGSTYLIAVEAGQEEASNMPHIDAYRVDKDLNQIGAEPLRISAKIGTWDRAERPHVATDGTNFVVVFEETRYVGTSGTSLLTAARVSPDGALLDGNGITVATGYGWFPKIAFDGTGYLVTFHSIGADVTTRLLLGVRMKADGTVLDATPITIINNKPQGQLSTLAAKAGQFLLVWVDERNKGSTRADIYATRIAPDGQVLDPTGILLGVGTSKQGGPAVAFDGTQFLFAWHDLNTTDVPDVWAARFDKKGDLVGDGAFAVSQATGPQTWPAVAATASGALVAWEDRRDGATGPDVYAARVSPAGQTSDPDGIAVSKAAGAQGEPAVAAGAGKFLVAFSDASGADKNVVAVRVAADGQLEDATPIAVASGAGEQSQPGAAFDGANFLVVWTDGASGDSNILGARVSPAGQILDSTPIEISKATGAQESPAVEFDGTNFLVLWTDKRGADMDVYGARVDKDGKVLDAAGIAVAGGSGDQRRPKLAKDGVNMLAVYENGGGVAAVWVGSAGQPVPQSTTSVTSATNFTERRPSVASDGKGTGLVAYESVYGIIELARARLVTTPNNGEPCTDKSQCHSGNCVDGVCCNTACGDGALDDCQACSVSKGAPADGTCSPAVATHVCRAANGACDAAEKCDGTALTCPADGVAADTVVCREADGDCDAAEKCDGQTKSCPSDAVKAGTETCRASAGDCDVAEKCDGATKACPTDGFKPATETCRAAAGACDAAEKCTGAGKDCPTDAFLPATETCRPAGGDCDVAEKCTGTAKDCPADTLKKATEVCRAAAGDCDVEEKCDGKAKACPTDLFKPATEVCRQAAGECDVGENCSGASAECPADVPKADGEACATGKCEKGTCTASGGTDEPGAGAPASGCDCSTGSGAEGTIALMALTMLGGLFGRRRRHG